MTLLHREAEGNSHLMRNMVQEDFSIPSKIQNFLQTAVA